MVKILLAACLIAVVSISLLSSVTLAQDKKVMDHGARIYIEYCKTCHMDKGQGMGTTFPPLAGADYLKTVKKETVIHQVIFGLSGKIKVNGKSFNGVMAPLPDKYTDEDVAAVMTYVYNSWGNKGPVITAAEVKKIRADGKKKGKK